MIIDGRAIATEILTSVRGKFEHVPIVRAVTCAPSPATLSYLRIKEARAVEAGMKLEIIAVPETASNEEVIEAIQKPGADAVIVQLPLPPHLSTEEILHSIPRTKDADVLSPGAYAAFVEGGEDATLPPVVCAVQEVLARSNVPLTGKRAVVVGQGKLVGRPVALWLEHEGAQVTVVTKEKGNLHLLKDADIIVSGAGHAGLITPEHIKEGVVLIDAGTSEQGGQMVGDADPACAQKALVFTPVPGGMGPIAVACLFRNVVSLLERSLQEQ
jgi:methylenetetrahydrofolate dehydrogenase (NADP+) / methenyltetrahydrofolate cyclohydrolase